MTKPLGPHLVGSSVAERVGSQYDAIGTAELLGRVAGLRRLQKGVKAEIAKLRRELPGLRRARRVELLNSPFSRGEGREIDDTENELERLQEVVEGAGEFASALLGLLPEIAAASDAGNGPMPVHEIVRIGTGGGASLLAAR